MLVHSITRGTSSLSSSPAAVSTVLSQSLTIDLSAELASSLSVGLSVDVLVSRMSDWSLSGSLSVITVCSVTCVIEGELSVGAIGESPIGTEKKLRY